MALTVTASFTAPPGSLLVALTTSSGGAGVTTMAVSGGGLAWSEQVKNNPSAGDYAGVWIAQIPAAAGGGAARPGQTWLRRFHHRQVAQQSPAAAAAAILPAPAIITATRPVLPQHPVPHIATRMTPGFGVAFVPAPTPYIQAMLGPPSL